MTFDPNRDTNHRNRQPRRSPPSRDHYRDIVYNRSAQHSKTGSQGHPSRRYTQHGVSGRPAAQPEQFARRRVREPDRQKNKRLNFAAPVILIVLLLAVLTVLVWGIMTRKPNLAKAASPSLSAPASNPDAPVQTNELGLPSLSLSTDTALPLSGKVILLDPGHGGNDPGCVYPATDPEYFEMEVNLELALLTKAELEKLGACVILFRSDNDWLSLYSRPAMAHLYALDYAKETNTLPFSADTESQLREQLKSVLQINDDSVDSGGMGLMSGTGAGEDLQKLMQMEFQIKDILYISIHCNANDDSSLHGTQVYYITDDTVIESETRLSKEDPAYYDRPLFPNRDPFYGRDGDRNQILAQTIYDAVTSRTPALETNAYQIVKENFAVLREQGMTGVLVETGFFTNDNDRQMLLDPAFQQEIAVGIAQGCSNFFSGRVLIFG